MNTQQCITAHLHIVPEASYFSENKPPSRSVALWQAGGEEGKGFEEAVGTVKEAEAAGNGPRGEQGHRSGHFQAQLPRPPHHCGLVKC